MMAASKNILVIGAGELGNQVLRHLIEHNQRQETAVSVLLRPTSINSTDPKKKKEIESLRKQGVHLVSGDVVQDTEQDLSAVLTHYNTIISCTGFVSGKGSLVKLARAVLSAGTARFIPWQFGVDYDVIGRGSAQDLFDEQLDVRDLLRAQNKTRWAIISTGMFTSFLFEPFFGVVDIQSGSVRALGSWENRVTLTTPEDIGKITAEIVLGAEDEDYFANRPIFIGGDTISYAELASLVDNIAGKPMHKSVLTVEEARATLAKEPDNHLLKYQIVFGEGHGVSWDLSGTWNARKGIPMTTATEWAREHLICEH